MTSTQKEFYDIMRDETKALSNLSDFKAGSILDIVLGAASVAMNELSAQILSNLLKTYLGSAKGDDLEYLAVDHFGSNFARPLANKSTGTVTFSRPNSNAGDVTIDAGTIIKTEKDFDGTEILYSTISKVVLVGTSVNAQIVANEAGTKGNVSTGLISVIETTLTDNTITATNAEDTAGGTEKADDAEYYQFVIDKIQALAGATRAALEGAARAVQGVAIAKSATKERIVKEWDIENDQPVANAPIERIPYTILYISDANGSASDALIDEVKTAISDTRAAGVMIQVESAVAQAFNFIGSVTLNASGQNFDSLSEDLSPIINQMRYYVDTVLKTGEGFNKQAATEYINNIFGVNGSNDITLFSISVPSGNVAVAENVKLTSQNVDLV